MKSKLTKILAVICFTLSVSGLSAMAVPFDFYKLGRGAGVDFLPSNGTTIAGDEVSGSKFGSSLIFTSGGITATATGKSGSQDVWVVQDHENNWTYEKSAGLGVYTSNPYDNNTYDGSDDNVTSGETLRITFNREVTITQIGLRAEGHNFTGWASDSTFLFDGIQQLLPTGTGVLNGEWTGTSFTFAYNGSPSAGKVADQFYLASLEVKDSGRGTVPDGGATILLFGLSLLGLGAVHRRFARSYARA